MIIQLVKLRLRFLANTEAIYRKCVTIVFRQVIQTIGFIEYQHSDSKRKQWGASNQVRSGDWS